VSVTGSTLMSGCFAANASSICAMRSPSPPENKCQNDTVLRPPPNGGPAVAITPAAPRPAAAAAVMNLRRVKTGWFMSLLPAVSPCVRTH
jgi:hypothetical protein